MKALSESEILIPGVASGGIRPEPNQKAKPQNGSISQRLALSTNEHVSPTRAMCSG